MISLSLAHAPQDLSEDVEPTIPPSITSQYNSTGPLSFSSDDELGDWAILNGFEGDGSYDSPFLITGLNVTSISEPSLRLSNITDTWFFFENCIFQSHLWYETLDISNTTSSFFSRCTVYGAVILNDTEFSVISDTHISEALYVVDSPDTAIIGSWFGVNSQTYVMSIDIISTNVSFYENTFFGEFALIDCGHCSIIANSFFDSVYDDGFSNYWNANRYAEYDGSDPFIIPGSAESIDFNPESPETIPPTTMPPFISTPTPTETTQIPNPYTVDVAARRKRTQ
jgi:hypothetical protein